MKTIPHGFALLFCLTLLAPTGARAQAPQESSGTLDVRGVPLSEALVRLAQVRSLKLAYAPELVAGRTSGCVTRSLVVDEALRCVLGGSGLFAERLPNGVYVIRRQPGASQRDSLAAHATGTITGVVRGQPSGAILVGAHVRVVGTSFGAVSRNDGTFRIAHVPAGAHDLEVSMLGFRPARYRRVSVPAQDGVEVEVELAETAIALGEVVVASQSARSGGDTPPVAVEFGGIRVGSVSVGFLFGSARQSRLQVNGLGGLARDSLEGLQIGGLFNATTGAARGAQFAGLVNTINGDLRGAQFAGLVNVTRRDVYGTQMAGLFNVSRAVDGLQGAGLSNVAYGGLDGVQLGGIFNTADAPSRGFQAAGVFNVAGAGLRGTQVAGVFNAAGGDVSGFQAAGIANVGLREVRRAQLAGIVNVAGRGPMLQAAGVLNVAGRTAPGVQVAGVANVAGGPVRVQTSGVLNVAGTVKHAQVGLFNFARANEGVPVGLFSYVHDVGLRFDVWADETGLVTAAVRSGNRRFSNYLGYGAHPSNVRFGRGPVAGFGTEFALARRAFGTVDLLHQGLADRGWKDWATVNRLRMTFGWKLNGALAVFGGPALNLLVSDERDGADVAPWRTGHGRWGSVYYAVWPGFSFGVRASTRP